MISSCSTSILLQCFHDAVAEFRVIVVSEKQHLVAQQFHGFLKFRRVFLSDFAESYISFISQSSDAWQVKRLSAFLITISEYSGKGDEG